MYYSFSIYKEGSYLPLVDVNSEDRQEFLELLEFVDKVPGSKAVMGATDGEENVDGDSFLELTPEKDDYQDGRWLTHYALAVVEGEQEEICE